MAQFKDDGIKCVFLSGSAGSGKTILAIALALEQGDKYENIVITRPQVSFSNQEKNGFLPGDISEKLAPWLVPIEQNIRSLEKINYKKKVKPFNYKKNNSSRGKSEEKPSKDTNLFNKYGIDIFSLEYIRGTTWVNTLFIVDESQNLTPQQIKTIITRVGEGSKIIFTGDLGQIDLSYLSAENSGLAYAIDKLTGYTKENGLVASVTFNYSVRSELAALANKLL
jgi:PhoH-like ATPase